MDKNTPSKTARGVASALLALSEDRTMPGLVSRDYGDQLEALLLATGTVSRTGVALARNRWMAAFYRWITARMMPGQYEAFGRRKQFFEARARAALEAGARLVLVLGAGYDLVCYRLAPEFPAARFFETDHPATATVKVKGLRAVGVAANVTALPLDLTRTTLSEGLSDVRWDRAAPSIVLAEALTQYLPEETVREMLVELAEITGPGSRFVLTFVGWDVAQGRPEAGPNGDRMLARAARVGEPWLWGCAPDELAGFVAGSGWEVSVAPEPAGLDNLAELSKPVRQA